MSRQQEFRIYPLVKSTVLIGKCIYKRETHDLEQPAFESKGVTNPGVSVPIALRIELQPWRYIDVVNVQLELP